MLEFFAPNYLLLLALVAEFAAAAMRFVRLSDGNDGLKGIAKSAAAINVLEGELRHLFSYRDTAGNIREPFALSDKYTAGFVQTLYRGHLDPEPQSDRLRVGVQGSGFRVGVANQAINQPSNHPHTSANSPAVTAVTTVTTTATAINKQQQQQQQQQQQTKNNNRSSNQQQQQQQLRHPEKHHRQHQEQQHQQHQLQ